MPLLSPYILYPSGGGGASVADDFERPDENLEADANWTAGTDHTAGNAQVVSNQLQFSGTSLSTAFVIHGTSLNDDQWAEMEFVSVNTVSVTEAAVLCRCSDSGSGLNGYGAEYLPATSQVRVSRWTNGGRNTRETISSITLTAGDVLRIEANGTTQRAYVNGSPIGTGSTDANHTSGTGGVYSIMNNASDSMTWDNFDVGNV